MQYCSSNELSSLPNSESDLNLLRFFFLLPTAPRSMAITNSPGYLTSRSSMASSKLASSSISYSFLATPSTLTTPFGITAKRHLPSGSMSMSTILHEPSFWKNTQFAHLTPIDAMGFSEAGLYPAHTPSLSSLNFPWRFTIFSKASRRSASSLSRLFLSTGLLLPSSY